MRGGRRSSSRTARVILAAVVIAAGWALAAPPAGAIPSFSFSRLAGGDRYATAAAIATAAFPSGAETVVVATGENFPDALAGNYLAGTLGAPILLTTRSVPVPGATLAALQTLKARNVVLLGLTGAISQAVENALAATTSTASGGGNLAVTRLGGSTRYETTKAIVLNPGSSAVGSAGGRRTAFLASGEAFPDALSVGPVSYARKYPTILTTPGSLHTAASDALSALGIQQVIVAGGTTAVSASTELAVQALGITTLTRFNGADRSETSRIAADFAIDNLGFRTNHLNVATGDNAKFGVDALAGGPHGGREQAVNVITFSGAAPGKATEFAAARSAELIDGHVFGGPDALPDAVVNPITAGARGQGTVPARPTIAAITPSTGPSSGNTPFTITGTNLGSTSVVDFCGVSPASVVVTATTVSGTPPARPNGACFVNVSAAGGSAGVTYTYTGGPTISSLTPSVGPVSGGTSFTITGTALGGTTSVDFCGASATLGTVTATTVTGTTPARAAGRCTVTVTTSGGSAFTTFSFGTGATITGITPLSGPVGGGTPFTITGSGLGGTTAVDFCGAAAASVSSTSTTVSGTTPGRPAGTCIVTVTTPSGNVTTTFTFGTGPIVTSITPASGPVGGGTSVAISGQNLAGTTAVTFCGAAATTFNASATTVTAITPARPAGVCQVTLTTPDGAGTVNFVYGGVPSITSITPVSGTVSGGTSFTITGANLGGTTSVQFCGADATNVVVNAAGTSITGSTPARPAGTCLVTVSSTSGPATTVFTFTTTPAAPTISSISPTSGPSFGGTAYSITGTNLAGATSVNFCGSNDTGFTVNAGGTTLTGTTPARSLGFGACNVVVTTPGGTANVNFTYNLL